MYFWKVDELVEDFKSNNVSQEEELKYAIFSTILISVALDPLLCIGISYNIL